MTARIRASSSTSSRRTPSLSQAARPAGKRRFSHSSDSNGVMIRMRHVLIALCLTLPAVGQTALPPAIDAAFKTAYPQATIKHVSKETEAGKPVYEVESIDGGLRRDLIYRPDGTVVSYEEELAEASVPAAVIDAIKTRYPKAAMTRFEKVFEKSTITFEIQLKGAGPSEAVLTPEGQWISPKKK